MKISILILFLLVMLQSCQSNLLIDNKPIIAKIESLDFSKTIFEVSIDNNENVIDTLSFEKIKTGENGSVLYEFKELRNKDGKIIIETYYRDNEDLFLEKTDYKKKNANFCTKYETFVNYQFIIDKAYFISTDSIDSDTLFMKYKYLYDGKGRKENLSITSITDSLNSVDFTRFNINEKAESGYLIIDNDTLEKRKMKFRNGEIAKSIHEYRNPFIIESFDYDKNKNVKSRRIFKKVDGVLKVLREYVYKYSNPGNPDRLIIKDFENDTILKRKFIVMHLPG